MAWKNFSGAATGAGERRPVGGGWRVWLAGMVVALPLCACGLFGHDLWRPAEVREAAIAREMIEDGDWTATYLDRKLFLEKPPLYTWTLALPLKIWGWKDPVVRIPVLLFALGALGGMVPLARRRLGAWGAAASVPILASMALFIEVNHGAMIDNGLLFFVTLAMLSFERMDATAGLEKREARGGGGVANGGGRRASFWGWAVLFYAATGAAFLCKGGIGLGLIGAGAGLFVLVRRRWRMLASWHWAVGTVVLAAVVGTWLWALWRRGGAEYFRVFFVVNHWNRFVGTEGPTAPWYAYAPQMLAACAPWTLVIPGGIAELWRAARAKEEGAGRYGTFLLCWAVGMFVLLSAAGGKDSQYVLPILPPMAVACGAWVGRWTSGEAVPRWSVVLFGIVVAFWVLAAMGMPWIPLLNEWVTAREAGRAMPPFLWRDWVRNGIDFGVAVLWGALAIGAVVKGGIGRRKGVALVLAGVLMSVGLSFGAYVENVLNEHKSSRPLIAFLDREVPEGTEVWGYDLNENTRGAMIYYGYRRGGQVWSVEEAARLAKQASQNPELPVRLLMCKPRLPYAPLDEVQAEGGGWKLQNMTRLNHRYYWLLQPAESAGEAK